MLNDPMTWFAGTFTFLGVSVILLITLIVFYKITSPVAGPYFAVWKAGSQTPLLAIFQKNGRCRLQAGKYISEVFENSEKQNPLAFFKSDQGGSKVGAVDLELFYDGAGTATSPKLVVLVQELKRMGYKNIDEVMDAFRAGKFKGERFEGKDGEVIFNDGMVSIPLIRQFNPAQVEAFSLTKPGIVKAYTDTKLNIDRAMRDEPIWKDRGIQGLAMIILFACIGIGIMSAMGVF